MKELAKSNKFDALRQQAEKIAHSSKVDLTDLDLEHIQHLLNVLAVHQVELEMQHDELQNTLVNLRQEQQKAETNLTWFTQLFNLSPIAHLILDERKTITQCNQAFCALTGLNEKRLLGRTLAEYVYSEDRTLFDILFKQILQFPDDSHVEFRLLQANQNPNYVHLTAKNLLLEQIGEANDSRQILVALTNIQDLKDAETSLQLVASVFDSARESIMITDGDNCILTVNKSFTRVTGYDFQEVAGKNPRLLKSNRHDTDFYTKLWSSINDKSHWEGEIMNKRKNGEIYPAWISITVLRDTKGKINRHIAIFMDITAQKDAQAIITRQATYDALTQLPNRVLFLDRLSQAIKSSHRETRSLGLMFLDLDRFKEVNDTLRPSHG